MQKIYKNKYVLDLLASFMFFTRIPINWSFFSNKKPDLTEAAWTFPLVGLIVGCLSGIVGDCLITIFGLPIFLSCVISISFSVFLTGAFHEDGLADSADGLGAGGTPKKINNIIHDSRLGTYGVITLVLFLLIRLGLTLALIEQGFYLLFILAIGFATGKLAIMFTRNLFILSSFANTAGVVGKISNKNFFLAIVIWMLPTFFIFPFWGILLGMIFVSIVIFFIGTKSKKALGGITGDILGAVAFLAEVVFLFGIVMVLFMIN